LAQFAADVATVKSARLTVVQALRERDWRRRAGAAFYGLLAMMSLHYMMPGPCATLAARTYDELLDLHDAYAGENFRPLARLVSRDVSVRTACG
jgi:hypothetical protein